jgi:hypothetical protein
VALLQTLRCYNCALTSLYLCHNTRISPVLHDAIAGALAARRVLYFRLKPLLKPLKERAIPLAVQAVHLGLVYKKEKAIPHCDKEMVNAGFVFFLVRGLALNAAFL